MRRASAQTTIAMLLVSRSVVEGALFAALLSVAQVVTSGGGRIGAIPIVAATLGLTGVSIILASVLRDARADRQNVAIALGAMGAAAALGIAYAPPHPEGLMVLTRIVLFGIIGEAFVWRSLSVARSLVRWSDARNAGFAALGACAVVALVPGTIDRAGLVIVGLAATAATGIGLSLARSAEELSLAGREARGETSRASASGTAIMMAILAIVGAAIAPFTGGLFTQLGAAIAPLIGELLYGVLLALGYAAALVVELFRLLFSLFRAAGFEMPQPPPRAPFDDAEALRQIEASRPFVIGAIELIIAAIALLVVVILVDRMARERRQALPDGATLDRESVAGEGLGSFLAGLLPRRRRRAGAPRDDGTPAGALRALYWRYLAWSDARGVAWRGVGETPAEHHRRALVAAPAHAAATVLVRAFEDLRYGERDPDAVTVTAARRGLAAIEEPR